MASSSASAEEVNTGAAAERSESSDALAGRGGVTPSGDGAAEEVLDPRSAAPPLGLPFHPGEVGRARRAARAARRARPTSPGWKGRPSGGAAERGSRTSSAAPSPDGVTPPRPASASELSDLSAAAPVFTSSAEADDEATPRESDRARLMTRPRGGSHE